MELQTLNLFVEVARRGSFAAVARTHGVDPSSVSRVVGLLEAQLGVRLLQRSTRRMVLTEAGERLLAQLAPLLDELGGVLNDTAQRSAEPSGTLRLTTSITFGHLRVLPLLPEFRQRYPQVKLDCLFSDEVLDLLDHHIDLAVRLAPVESPGLVVSKLIDTHYRVVASPDYLRRTPPLRQPADVAQHNCLLMPYRNFKSHWLFRDAQGQQQEVPVQGDITLSTPQALRDAALLHLGPTLLADWLACDALHQGTLVDPFPDYAVTASSFDAAAWLVYPSRSYLPAKVRVMIDFLRERLGAPPTPPCALPRRRLAS